MPSTRTLIWPLVSLSALAIMACQASIVPGSGLPDAGAQPLVEDGGADAGSTDAGAADAGEPDAGVDAGSVVADDGGPGIFVAVGYRGRRMRTTDGLTWTDDVEMDGGGGDDNQLLRGVAFGAGQFVGVGWRTLTSPDGTAGSWTDHGVMGQWLQRAAYSQGKWAAAGGYGRRTSGTDGFTWHDAPWDNETRAFRAFGYEPQSGRWIAVGDNNGGNGVCMTSVDGAAWTACNLAVPQHLGPLAVGGGRVVALGGGKDLYVSRDGGLTWTQTPVHTFPTDIDSLAYGSRGFLAVGGGHAYTSQDLTTWEDAAVGGLSGPSACAGSLCVVNDGTHAWRSLDGGKTWERVQTFTASTRWLTDIAFGRP